MAASDNFGARFRLVTSDGDPIGTVEAARSHFQAGGTVVLDGVVYRIRSVVPIERLAEFIDAPHNGLLEVEPLTSGG